MSNLKNIKRISTQLASLPKLYNSHVWITPPSSNGFSFLGISDYSIRYFVRLNRINFDDFLKTGYGIMQRQYIRSFIQQNKQLMQKGELPLSLQRQCQRFYIKQNQPFCLLQTIQFDIELQAPVDMRVVEINFQIEHKLNLMSSPYYFIVQVLNPAQLSLLSTEEQYKKSKKIFMY